jgi:hypothetical protein
VRVQTVTELETYLERESPNRVDVEFHEGDTRSWGTAPEAALLEGARRFGYTATDVRAGGRAPFFGWMGSGTRYVSFTLTRAEAEPVNVPVASRRFLRVAEATYCVDRSTSTHTGRTVSGYTRDEVMAEAYRRAQPGWELVALFSSNDPPARPMWTEDGGFTQLMEQEEPLEQKTRFHELTSGDSFFPGRAGALCSKVDERHAENLETGNRFEIDPYVWVVRL